MHEENGQSAAQVLWLSSSTREHEKVHPFGSDTCSSLTLNLHYGAPFASPSKLLSPSVSPEERAQEEVIREEEVEYTRPEFAGVPYYSRRPDFYLYFDGLGCISEETKNRKTTSYQDEVEARRDFSKQSPYPLYIWGSYNLTEQARNQMIANSPVGTTLCPPIGFRYQDNPDRWKEKYRIFIRKLKEKGVKLLTRLTYRRLHLGTLEKAERSPVGERVSLDPEHPTNSQFSPVETDQLKENSNNPQSSSRNAWTF
jgi:hypothetical protein